MEEDGPTPSFEALTRQHSPLGWIPCATLAFACAGIGLRVWRVSDGGNPARVPRLYVTSKSHQIVAALHRMNRGSEARVVAASSSLPTIPFRA